MKQTQPSHQTVLQSSVSTTLYRFLCLFMAAFLFCGAQTQLIAAALPPGANDLPTDNTPASGDGFNNESFLQASGPTSHRSPHLTLTEKVGAAIAGAVLLLSAGGRQLYLAYREERAEEPIREQQELQRERIDGDSGSNSEFVDSSSLLARGNNDPHIAENNSSATTAETAPTWGTKLSDGLIQLRKGAYDLVTLKPCWPAVEKPILDQLADVRKLQLKNEQANELAKKSLKEKIYDLFTLKQYPLPTDLTERQQKTQEMAPLESIPITQLTTSKFQDLQQHLDQRAERQKSIDDLTPSSQIEDIRDVLDPEMNRALDSLVEHYSSDGNENEPAFKKLAYFVAKNDAVHPGHLIALRSAFEGAKKPVTGPADQKVVDASQALIEKMNEAVEQRWVADTAKEDGE